MTRKFAHEALFDQSRKGVKVYCRCGAQSSRMESWGDAQKAYLAHVGLKELERKQLLH